MYERQNKYQSQLLSLSSLVKKLLAISKQFYKDNKRNYGKPQVPRDFFKHINLHKEFSAYFENISELKKNSINGDIEKLMNNLLSID